MTQKSSQTESKETKKPLVGFAQMTERQKKILAGIFSLVFLIGIFVTISIVVSPDIRNSIFARNQQSNTSVSQVTDEFDVGPLLNQIQVDSLLFSEYTYEELNLYPPAWVDKYFTESEQANALFSGPTADADKDGLINKLEYLYGADPRNQDTLCNGNRDREICVGRNDKENVDAGISPLTGLPEEGSRPIRLTGQDEAVLEVLEESIYQAAEEGVDFPTLYQLSGLVDFTENISQIEVNTVSKTRDNIIEYSKFQAELIESIIGQDETTTLTQIFAVTNVEEMQALKESYVVLRDDLVSKQVPEGSEDIHRSFIFIFERLVELSDIRIQAIQNNTTEDEAVKQQLKDKAVELVWGYRFTNEQQIKQGKQ